MTAKDMVVGLRYLVTAGSVDGEFEIGDRIWLSPDGAICNQEAGGWMPAEEVAEATRGMLCEVDKKWLQSWRERLQAMADGLAAHGI